MNHIPLNFLKKFRNIFYFFLFVSFSSLCLAHGPHEHGKMNIEIAQDSPKELNILVRSPSISIYGFEHVASSTQEKKQLQNSLKQFQTHLPEMISFPMNLSCKVTSAQFNPFAPEEEISTQNKKSKISSQHGNFEAQIRYTCNAPFETGKILFSFSRFFPQVHELNVQYLSEKVQKSIEIEKGEGALEI